ncbi:hypothetical protein NUW58_g6578 [Xylaria curta]|uniref:Uncharacterized protein n=1 Tax=Xylaria curta TaxID=42375 RepID=A0ACC1NTX6_9PEZI|nr:hypothetical protein NUW58_g6578 [Xylaria curta]
MSANLDLNSISLIIQRLEEASYDYNKLKEDRNLGAAFHASGRALDLIQTVLRPIETLLQNGGALSKKSRGFLDDCDEKSKVIKSVFNDIAQKPPRSRPYKYKAVMQQLNEGMGVGTSMVQTMEDVCDLAEDNILGGPMEEDIKRLREIIDELSEMEPTLANRQADAFNAWDNAKQFNSLGGNQSNNAGPGNQFNSTSFHATVHFNQLPNQESPNEPET